MTKPKASQNKAKDVEKQPLPKPKKTLKEQAYDLFIKREQLLQGIQQAQQQIVQINQQLTKLTGDIELCQKQPIPK